MPPPTFTPRVHASKSTQIPIGIVSFSPCSLFPGYSHAKNGGRRVSRVSFAMATRQFGQRLAAARVQAKPPTENFLYFAWIDIRLSIQGRLDALTLGQAPVFVLPRFFDDEPCEKNVRPLTLPNGPRFAKRCYAATVDLAWTGPHEY